MVLPAALLTTQSRGVTTDYPPWGAGRFWLARRPATGDPVTEGDAERPASSALLGMLERKDIPIADCSAAFALSLQELRRSLAVEGTSLRQVRRTALVERARPHPIQVCSVDDLAALLSYPDARSLGRALKLAAGPGISDLRRDAMTPTIDHMPLMTRLRTEILRLE